MCVFFISRTSTSCSRDRAAPRLDATDGAVLHALDAPTPAGGAGRRRRRRLAALPPRGLGPAVRCTVALPEIDGQSLRAISFKTCRRRRLERTEFGELEHEPLADRSRFCPKLAAPVGWNLRRCKAPATSASPAFCRMTFAVGAGLGSGLRRSDWAYARERGRYRRDAGAAGYDVAGDLDAAR